MGKGISGGKEEGKRIERVDEEERWRCGRRGLEKVKRKRKGVLPKVREKERKCSGSKE